MRDAIGGVMTIQIIIIFLLLINGYLAFSVNYTKAFRVKNQIINVIEQHEGHTEDAKAEIKQYLNQTHYTVPSSYTSQLSSDYTCEKGYCIKAIVTGDNVNGEQYRGTYYHVVTFVNIDVPILNKILPLVHVFQVDGETKLIYSSGNDSELTK